MKRSLILLVAAALLGACGDSDDDGGATTTTTTTTAAVSTTAPASESGVAMWPDAATTFTTPEAAARDFVSKVLDVPPTLGAFQAGDSRSGEIEVFSPGESGTAKIKRATLVLRQLGANNGWFVISAGSDGASITNLSTGDEVSASSVKVMGQARGFEGNVVVSAYVRGDDVELGKAVTQAGSMGDTEAFSVNLELAAPSRSTIFVVVRGGTGLETDPGEFAAIPLVVR